MVADAAEDVTAKEGFMTVTVSTAVSVRPPPVPESVTE
jgi:hypothetical protein